MRVVPSAQAGVRRDPRVDDTARSAHTAASTSPRSLSPVADWRRLPNQCRQGAHAAIPRFRLSVRPLEPISNFEFDEGTPVSEETLRIAAPWGSLANLLTNSEIGARKRAADRTEAEHD